MKMMSSKDKTIQQLKKLDLSPIKLTENKYHLYADYIELISFFSSGQVSPNDILDKFRKEDIVINTANSITSFGVGIDKYEVEDKNELWIKDVFSICQKRNQILESVYPYSIKDDFIELKDNLDERQKLYLFLLLSSNLNYFPDIESYLTTDFETVSFYSLKQFLPSNSIVKQFGKKSDYVGNAQEKIKSLGKDLNVFINEIEINRNVNGTQERGLDIIGWIPFKDFIPNMIVIYGQCACGKEWYKKQGETRRYENSYFPLLKHRPINTMFIPFALIENENFIFQSDEVDCLLFERFRILEYLPNPTFYKDLEAKLIIDECLSFTATFI